MDSILDLGIRPTDQAELLGRRAIEAPLVATGPTVLLVGGDPTDQETLTAFLGREGFEVCLAQTAADALAGGCCAPAIVLMEVALTDFSGFDLCRKLRTRSGVPIITIVNSAKHDPVTAFEAGADDCISKPVRLRELVARLRACIRRAPESLNPPPRPTIVQGGNVHLDATRRHVMVGTRQVFLPAKEFSLLEFLLSNDGQVLRREAILDRVWGPHWTGGSKTLDAHVSRLRQRLTEAGASSMITTIRGLGYLYETCVTTTDNVVSLDLGRDETRDENPALTPGLVLVPTEGDVVGRSASG